MTNQCIIICGLFSNHEGVAGEDSGVQAVIRHQKRRDIVLKSGDRMEVASAIANSESAAFD